ncbi:hypothetical protein ACTXT7_006415 [Hymenolepis weldensis]
MVNVKNSSNSSPANESKMKNLDKSDENPDIQKVRSFFYVSFLIMKIDADAKEGEKQDDGEGPSVVTEAGEDGDDEQSALLDRQMESERRKVRRLRRKKRETDCSMESSGEETETMMKKNMLSSTDTEGADNSSKVFTADACKSNDPIFDAIIEAVKSGKLNQAMELLRSYASFKAFDKKMDSKEEEKQKESMHDETPIGDIMEKKPRLRKVEGVMRGGNTPEVNAGSIIEVVVKGLPRAMHALLRDGGNPLEVTCGGNTALHWASARGHLECVSGLIEYGVPLDPLNDCEETPLMLAAQNGHADIVNLLLKLGASSNFELNRFGDSPLTLACFKAREDVISILLNSEHRPIGKRELNAALSRSSLRGSAAVAELLLERGADVNSHESEVIPPLHAAIFAGNAVMVELLIARGADVEMPNRSGYRPLMEAVRRGYRDIAESLLLAGAAVEAVSKTDHEITALSLAIDSGYDRLCVLLEKFRALRHSN